ncbi:MAG TPA: aminotransferase class III-fold pyridoxal phosphate-dependent enzyme [Candidatus Dormibacteraeota bacterium]|jgi:4-aminobutyrate aminotransferase
MLAATDAATWRERDAELISPAYHRYSDLVVESAEGAHLHTVDGRDVLDFGCGIGVTNLGHRHPAVVAAVHEQVDRLWHTSVTAFHPQMIEAAASLVSITPPSLDQVFLNNTGAEAVEGAIKLARRSTGRSDIIAFVGGFHGRTYGALSVTASKATYRRGMGPLLPGVHHIRYPYCFRYCSHPSGALCDLVERELELLFATTTAPDTVAAILVEPVQGEGGYVVPPAAFMPMLRNVCDEHGILLIADEVQSGFGRTGRMFAVEHTGVEPDIMCVAKALGNGMPIAATIARHRVMRAWHEGEHGSTFGGNPVACAAAIAVIDTLTRERLPERAERLGRKVMERARSWQADMPALADVRGLGLMIGLEFMQGGAPATALVDRIAAAALARELLVLSCGIDGNVIRLIPPLTIPESELDAGLDILEAAMREVAR